MAVLAGIFAIRMLGLFMLLPVLALYAEALRGAAPTLIGVALGAYGATQALFQIPFGLLSDRVGRRPIIVCGLALFAAGSAVAALSDTIGGVIAGRALQGAGAVSAAVIALLADLTRPEVRTRAMAFVGASIGGAFVLALVVGPALTPLIGVPGLFWLTAGLAGLAAAVLLLAVPEPPRPAPGRLRRALPRVLLDGELLRLDFGIFALHLALTASFVAVPFALRDELGIAVGDHWQIYLGVLLASLAGTVPLVLLSERVRRPRSLLRGAIIGVAAAQAMLALYHGDLWPVLGALTLFFAVFNFLEARLPAELSGLAPAAERGAALGVYASAQFLGTFAGGVLGGWLLGRAGPVGVFAVSGVVVLVWWAVTGWQRDIGDRPGG